MSGRLEYAMKNLTVVIVGKRNNRFLAETKTESAGAARGQRAGGEMRAVTEFACGREHAPLGCRRNCDLEVSGEDVTCCRRGYACQFRDFT